MNLDKLDPLVTCLVADDLVDAVLLERALEQQATHGGRLDSHLLALGAIDEAALVAALAQQYGIMPARYRRGLLVEHAVYSRLDLDTMRRHRVLATHTHTRGEAVRVLCTEPPDAPTRARLEARLGARLDARLWPDLRFVQAMHILAGDPLPSWARAYLKKHAVAMQFALDPVYPDVASALESNDILGFDWFEHDVLDYFEACFDRDTLLKVLLGHTGKWLSRRLVAVVSRRGLQPYFLEEWPELPAHLATLDALRALQAPVAPDAPCLTAPSIELGSPQLLGLSELFETLEVPAPPLVASTPLHIGNRAAMLLVGVPTNRAYAMRLDEISESFDLAPVATAAAAVGRQLEELIRRAKTGALPPPGARIPPAPAERIHGPASQLSQASDVVELRPTPAPAGAVEAPAVARKSLSPRETQRLGHDAKFDAAGTLQAHAPGSERSETEQLAAVGRTSVGGMSRGAAHSTNYGMPIALDELSETAGSRVSPGSTVDHGWDSLLEAVSEVDVTAKEANDAGFDDRSAAGSEGPLDADSASRAGDGAGFNEAGEVGEAADADGAHITGRTLMGGFEAIRAISTTVPPASGAPPASEASPARGPAPLAADSQAPAPPASRGSGGGSGVPGAQIFRRTNRLRATVPLDSPITLEMMPADAAPVEPAPVSPNHDQPGADAPRVDEPPADERAQVAELAPISEMAPVQLDPPRRARSGGLTNRSPARAPGEVGAQDAADDEELIQLHAEPATLMGMSTSEPSNALDGSRTPGAGGPSEPGPSGVRARSDAWLDAFRAEEALPAIEAPIVGTPHTLPLSEPGLVKRTHAFGSMPQGFADDEHDLMGPLTIPPEALEEVLDAGPQAIDIDESLQMLDSRDRSLAAAAAEHVATAGASALDALEKLFPGRLFVDRYQHTPETMPPVGEHGPVLDALVRIGAPSLQLVRRFIDHHSLELRFYATFLLTELPGDAMLEPLVARLFDRDQQIRAVAQTAVSFQKRHPDFERLVLTPLLQALSENGEEVRVEVAADALRQLKDVRAVAPLIDALGTHQGRTRLKIHQALRAITLQDLGPILTEWRNWWFGAHDQHRALWLVAALDSPSDTLRQMAFAEVQALPGFELNYHPDQPPSLRQRAQRDLSAWFQLNRRA